MTTFAAALRHPLFRNPNSDQATAVLLSVSQTLTAQGGQFMGWVVSKLSPNVINIRCEHPGHLVDLRECLAPVLGQDGGEVAGIREY
jgi:hypothetical protein